ncbi:MAG: MATE family efflux transporter, partial [Candidatus Brocadiia bacterium]|nr:MATE family efflux transporter [Candidatus Brocadiia bacterium]
MAGPLTSVFRKRDLTSGSLAGNLFHLAAPLAVGAALHALYGIVDAFWLGRFGAHAITAPGVSLPFLFIVISLGMGFGHAGTPLVAQHTGAGRHQDAYHVAGQILLLLCVLAGVMALPAVVFAPQLLALARVKDGVAVIAVPYLRIVMLGIPLTALAIGYGSVLRALGNSITPVLIAVCSNIFNALLDPVLIFGLGGFPRLGATGAALATLASQVCAALVCLVLIKRRHAGLQIG